MRYAAFLRVNMFTTVHGKDVPVLERVTENRSSVPAVADDLALKYPPHPDIAREGWLPDGVFIAEVEK